MVNVLPMVPVTHRARDAVHTEGVAALRALLGKRADLDALFASTEACDHAIALSGGAIRDLFRIVIESVSFKRDLGLTVDDIDRGARELVSSYQRLLSGRDYLPKLVSIADTGDLASGLSDDDRRKLLQSMVVLEYNGTTWYDVHPLARRTTAFERARIASHTTP